MSIDEEVNAGEKGIRKALRMGTFSRRDFSKLTVAAAGGLAINHIPWLALDAEAEGVATQPMGYGIGPCWGRNLGDIRAVINVAKSAGAVRVRIPWRRRDPDPAGKQIILQESKSQKQIANVVATELNGDYGEIAFEPSLGPGEYLLYYMPYDVNPTPWEYSISYLPEKQTADPVWLSRYGLIPGSKNESFLALPEATAVEIETQSEFDRFDPMESVATEDEVQALVQRHTDWPWLLFPESREFPIRMVDDLPVRWAERGPATSFYGEARPNEFFVFQAGIYAFSADIENIAVEYADLVSDQGTTISGSAIRCFNLGGTGSDGAPLQKNFGVSKGKVGALWFGIQIPEDTSAGKFSGHLMLRSESKEMRMDVVVDVFGPALEVSGDDDIWRLSRLRWLDSTIAIDDEITAPYIPLTVQEQEITCLGRKLRFNQLGMPESIRVGGQEILASPVQFIIQTGAGALTLDAAQARIVKKSPGAVSWESFARSADVRLRCLATMEFDGYINFDVEVLSERRLEVTDIRLEYSLVPSAAVYMMGFARKGGYRPPLWNGKWDINRADNSIWLGNYDAGLQLNLKGPKETWEVFDLKASGIPKSWGNDGKGGCTVFSAGDRVTVNAFSGPRTLTSGERIGFQFGCLITPVKPLDPAHWKQRYYQQGYPEPGAVPIETLVQSGVTVVNIHQGNELNPWINYPFLTVTELSSYIDEVHRANLKAKIYYTVRELSNHVVEMWALRSLGDEIFVDGPGGGGAWLREHLVSHYKAAWHTTLPSGIVDQAIAETGVSRWLNFYLEGLAYLVRHTQMDGLYLDGIGYDRRTMKRVRKVLDRTRPGCLIDFHSGNNYTYMDYRVSPANLYMGHFPYINSLWFGEMFNYNESPDYWLVEISGIPFGLYSDMLEGGGNPWRGMVYGMTARRYQDANPTPIWRLWDEFGIQDAEMIGYWNPSCPIKTSCPGVLATAYRKSGKVLIAVASWAPAHVRCRLSVDWSAIGLKPEGATLSAPPIEGFQEQAVFQPSSEIPFVPGKGWLLILENPTS